MGSKMRGMSAETLARWQFGVTTVYHFLFVPITLALSFLVAILQTIWVRTGQERFLKLTKFYGKLFLINFAMGVVTGIVQEFQFGMNWSEYSRFVGDIFGAPLALEALLAFFLESTFLGLWIFGWDRLNKKVHLATIWLAAIGTNISAIFILAANAWMQNPVGFRFNPETNRAELTNFADVMLNPVFLATFPHQITASWLVAGALMAGIAVWHLHRISRQTGAHSNADLTGEHATNEKAFRFAAVLGAVSLLAGGVGVIASGDFQAKVMYEAQPMKMAAAEASFDDDADFSILTIGDLNQEEVFSIKIPGLLGFMATGEWGKPVPGINTLQEQYSVELRQQLESEYGPHVAAAIPDDYSPNLPISYWTYRIMMTLGFMAMAVAAVILFALRKGRLPVNRLWTPLMVVFPLMPLFGNSFGWIFTEMGRQPWLVFGVMPTAAGVSPGVSPDMVLFSLIMFTLVYGILAVIEVGLLLRYIKKGLPEVEEPKVVTEDDEPLSFAY